MTKKNKSDTISELTKQITFEIDREIMESLLNNVQSKSKESDSMSSEPKSKIKMIAVTTRNDVVYESSGTKVPESSPVIVALSHYDDIWMWSNGMWTQVSTPPIVF